MSADQSDKYAFFQIFITIFVTMLIVKYARTLLLVFIVPLNYIVDAMRALKYEHEDYNPRISVLIPAYNEEVGLMSTVQSVIDSEYKNVEIIVVNDGSSDGSDAIMTKFVHEYDAYTQDDDNSEHVTLKYFYKLNGGKGVALNYALDKAEGEIIVTIDADCTVTPTTMGNFVRRFADPSVMAAVGNVKIGNIQNVIGVVQSIEFLNSFYTKHAESLLGIIYIIGGAAGAYRKQVFDELGGYSPTNITEDIHLSFRMQYAGMKMVYAYDAVVYTEGASDFNGLAKQRQRWKIGWLQTMAEFKDFVFSRKKEHNKILAWEMLPVVAFGNVQTTFEPLFVVALYIYSYLVSDYTVFITWIMLETIVMFAVLVVERRTITLRTIFLTPITWLLFHITSYVEYQALMVSMWNIIRKKDVKWQRWERVGVGVNN
jgi:cellulose synthase/poly-beta-1,6-N-acetylglucosamine synthase-like glycosyltransferase